MVRTANVANDFVDGRKPVELHGDETTPNQARDSALGRLVPVALSALLEGLGQAYNRQPVKAAGLVITGLSLSTASGLNTWLMRRVLGAKEVTIGTERIQPWLLAAWAAGYAYSLWDAWHGAPKSDTQRGRSNL